jgi:hypothetical protein
MSGAEWVPLRGCIAATSGDSNVYATQIDALSRPRRFTTVIERGLSTSPYDPKQALHAKDASYYAATL